MTKRLAIIEGKLKRLKQLDPHYKIFGSKRHHYELNAPLPLEKVEAFEAKYKVKLPEAYVQFLTQMGNGGAGPYYGLESFEKALFNDLSFKSAEINPSKPFRFIEQWNMNVYHEDKEVEDKLEDEYFDDKQLDGAIQLSNFGCGISLLLVVNGDEYGHVWMDHRCNDGGICPAYQYTKTNRVDFLDWYEAWLEDAIDEINN